MGDHQVVRRCLLPGLLACLALGHAPAAAAHPWPACDAPDLTPAVGLERPAPPYPESARETGAEGYVDVAFTVLRDGHVGWAYVERAAPSGFFEAAALQGVRDWRYRPATKDGKPVECRIRTRVRFTLADAVPARPAGSAASGDEPAPVYPEQARLEGLEGYVDVRFTTDRDGRVTQAEVTTAVPRGEFEQAALDAVRRWRVPTASAGAVLSRRFDFALPDRYPHPPSATLLAAAPLPAEACSRRVAGRVTLEVALDAEGRITDARVLKASPAGLYDATALAVARNSRLATAWRAGMPIASQGLLTLSFEPDEAHCGSGGGDDPHALPRGGPPPRQARATAACRRDTLGAPARTPPGASCR